MGNWIKVKFKDYVYFQEGPGLMSYLFKESGFPFMNIRCIENGRIKKEDCQFISENIANGQYKHFQLEANDLIVSTSGTLGKKAFVKKEDLPLLLNTSIIRFKPKDSNRLDRNFLNYILEDHNFLYDLYNQSTGSAQINVGPSHLEKIWIRMPEEKSEQEAIAEILSSTDEAINKTESLIAKYQRIKTGLMQDLLTRGIDERGNIRSKATHKFVVKKGIEVPEEWEVYSIEEITDHIGSGVTPTGGSNVYTHSGVMLIRSQNVLIGEFDFNDVAFISEDINARMKRSQLKDLDVLLNITGASIGRSYFIPRNFVKANVNQHVCSIRIINPSEGKSIFLSNYLNDFKGQNQIKQLLGASNREGLNYQQIREIKVAMPKIATDDEFVRIQKILGSSEETIQSFKLNLFKLHSLKTGLMQDLLSGKVRVPEEMIE